MLYKDKEWLAEQRYRQGRLTSDIARECGVSSTTIEYFIRKYNIPKPLTLRELEIEILCHSCKEPFFKDVQYLKYRVREGFTRFYCTRACADSHHSINMMGDNNPNFGGSFHGTLMSERTPEERMAIGRKVSKTMIANRTSKGARNGRWAGGFRKVNCATCGKEKEVRPYIYRLIQAGKRVACCDHNCARIYGITQIKTERTSIEVKMADELARRSIEYVEQYNLGNKFALDFFLPKYGIVIECDGDYWHNLPDVAKRDRSKNAYIAACGYSLFRFWESEINESVAACVDIVMAEINAQEAA